MVYDKHLTGPGLDAGKVLAKAHKTRYKHPRFYLNQDISVYDAIYYYVKSRDFQLDVPRKMLVRTPELQALNIWTVDELIRYLISVGRYKDLVIRYRGKERGTDRGVLKVKTFIILKQLLEETKGETK